MCWSFGASAVLAIIGVVVAIYLASKKVSKLLWIPIFYFSLMELLQAITYLSINECSLPINQLLTFLGYLHITFQPFFINAAMMYFIPKNVRKKIQGYVFTICFIGAILMLTKLYPFDWAGTCMESKDSVFCGANLCSADGNWHLAWYIPLNGIKWLGDLGYVFPVFILPLIYGSWRLAIFITIAPALAYFTTTNPNEWPAIWCLFSIAFILVLLTKPIMKLMRVKKWYFWKYPFK